MSDVLPFADVKDRGAADFYFCINATFAYLADRIGAEGLRRYWGELGRDYMSPVWMRWREGGLDAVAAYLQRSFDVEPGSEARVERDDDAVELTVLRCPAISHLRANGRQPYKDYCQHCYFVFDSAARRAGLAVRVEGGNGSCRQRILPAGLASPQDLSKISTCSTEAPDARHL